MNYAECDKILLTTDHGFVPSDEGLRGNVEHIQKEKH